MFDFTDHVVIVTGAGGNLGSAVARGFLKAGARLCLAELTAELLSRRYPDLTPDGGHYLAAPVNANDPDSVQGMVEVVIARLGRAARLGHQCQLRHPRHPRHASQPGGHAGDRHQSLGFARFAG